MRYPLEIEVGDYLQDHHFEGRCVFPAAETLKVLAKVVQAHFSHVDMGGLNKARFPHFLIIPPEVRQLSVLVEVGNISERSVSALLLTSIRSKTGGIGRNLEHARVEFSLADSPLKPLPFQSDEGNPEGEAFIVPAGSIYPGLIPFGKAFQNIIGPVSIGPKGALASLSGGHPGTDDDWLGSPFPFDAAIQVACLWGQRFTEYVLFPLGFEKRSIFQKTKKGGIYLGRIIPVATGQNLFLFDALIFDAQGSICEEIRGIQMQDVSHGRLRPPLWIKELNPAQ
jgi:hypothetical protein